MNIFAWVFLVYVVIVTVIYFVDTTISRPWKKKEPFLKNICQIMMFYPFYLVMVGMFLPFFVIVLPYNYIKTGKLFDKKWL